MPTSTFSIRTTKQSITLSHQEEDHLLFSVHNRSTKAILPARAQIETDTPQIIDWITFIDGDEKDFAVEATQQFQVRVKVPHSAITGKYSFRLSMIGVESPDEHFTQGPSVSFVVPEKKVEPAIKKLPWLWIGLGGFLFAGVAGFLGWELIKEPPANKIAIGNYVGKPLAGIVQELENKGFEVISRPEENIKYGKDIITSQEPPAGSHEEASSIYLTYSDNEKLFELNNYAGLYLNDAWNNLIENGFTSISVQYRYEKNNDQRDKVVIQVPSQGTYSLSHKITLVVSKGIYNKENANRSTTKGSSGAATNEY